MSVDMYVLKAIRKINPCKVKKSRVDLNRGKIKNQNANDFVREIIKKNSDGLMITKFGTVELANVVCYLKQKNGCTLSDKLDYIRGIGGSIFWEDSIKVLVNNAGFFPKDFSAWEKYNELVLEDLKYVDILGSYIEDEKYVIDYLCNCKNTINLDGYLAPYKWNNPWTMVLEERKVLVVHPFAESVIEQYKKREFLFEDKNVLPKFKTLKCIKAVQSIANNGKSTGFNNWFDALQYMEDEIDKIDYDVAIIGCGAYGMNLAAHCKRRGKIAIHMASWVQMLFGIYGQRWISDNNEYKDFINEYWVRPNQDERPQNLLSVENGAYW